MIDILADATTRDGLLAAGVLVGVFVIAIVYMTLAFKRSKETGSNYLSDDRSKDLLLGILLIGLIAALAFPSLLNNAVVAGIFGSLAGFVFGRSTTDHAKTQLDRRDAERPSDESGTPQPPAVPPNAGDEGTNVQSDGAEVADATDR